MKLSRWAVGVLVVIWAVILLAPPLNLLFRVQLRGSETIRFSALPAPDAIPNFWEKTARRFPDDKNVLLQAALEYPVDENAAENDEEYSGEYDEEYYPPPPPLPGEPPSADAPPPYVPTLNPNLPASQVFPGQLEADFKREKIRRLDLLLKKFPRDPALIAIRLRATLDVFRAERRGGELSDPKVAADQPAGYVSPERDKEKTNFTAADFQKIVEMCARGNQLEPGNGFFDWMKCYFLTHAWRDADAFAALDAAARKRHYNDYALDELRFKLRALSRALGRELLFEEKQQHFMFNSFPHFSRFREMARILSWQSIKAQRRGDHVQALRITAGLARAGAHMRENSKTYIEGLVARAIESMAWSGPIYDARQAARRKTTPNQRIASFQKYAAQHGRPELAAEAARNYAAGTTFTNTVNASINTGAFGVPFWLLLLCDLLWKAGVLLLLLLPFALLLPALMKLFGRVPRVRRVLQLCEMPANETPAPREVWGDALACGGLRALGTLLCGALVLGLCAAGLMLGVGQGEQISETLKSIGFPLPLRSAGFDPGVIGEFYYSLSMMDELPVQWRYVVLLSPLLFGVLYAAWHATQWQKRANDETDFHLAAFGQTLFENRLYRAAGSPEHESLDIGGGVLKLVGFTVMALLTVAWLFLAITPSSDGAIAWLLPLLFVLLLAGVLLMEKFFIWRKRPRRAATVRYGLRLFQRSLSAWLVLGSALYLVTLLISLPLRARANAEVERIFEVGEVRAALK